MGKRRNVFAASLSDRRFSPKVVRVKKAEKLAKLLKKEMEISRYAQEIGE